MAKTKLAKKIEECVRLRKEKKYFKLSFLAMMDREKELINLMTVHKHRCPVCKDVLERMEEHRDFYEQILKFEYILKQGIWEE